MGAVSQHNAFTCNTLAGNCQIQISAGNHLNAAHSLRDASQESDGKQVPFSQGNLVFFLYHFGCLILVDFKFGETCITPVADHS